ncbi:MAG: hypothetical protein IAG13_00415 [Deltaproteobacteria bacterium]|nr:hypothetical protein [Nannocystaceae bacterium]
MAGVPVAGCPAGDDGSTGADDSSSSSSSDPTNSTTNGTTPTTSADSSSVTLTDGSSSESGTEPTVTGSTESGSDSSSGSGSGSGSDSSAGSDGDSSDSGSTGSSADLCQGFLDKVNECFPGSVPDEDVFLAACNEEREENEMYSAACGTAGDESLACIAVADCDDLNAEVACVEEFAAEGEACGGMSESGEEPPPPDEG